MARRAGQLRASLLFYSIYGNAIGQITGLVARPNMPRTMTCVRPVVRIRLKSTSVPAGRDLERARRIDRGSSESIKPRESTEHRFPPDGRADLSCRPVMLDCENSYLDSTIDGLRQFETSDGAGNTRSRHTTPGYVDASAEPCSNKQRHPCTSLASVSENRQIQR